VSVKKGTGFPASSLFSLNEEVVMAQANISISIDDGLKEQAESLFSKLGMDMSMAISIFLRQTVRQGKIPVDVSEENDPLQGFVIPESEENDPFWSVSNIRHLKKAIADIEAGKYVIHDIIEADDD
jgi:DNA-damage-inducible protein J